MNLEKDRRCFVCGEENPHSLKVKVRSDGERRVTAEFVARSRYRGWADYLHGGVLSLLFDELLGWISVYSGYDAMTARLEVRYRKPVPLGSKLTFTGELEKEGKGVLDVRTFAYFEDGSVAAEGKGRMMILGRREQEPMKMQYA